MHTVAYKRTHGQNCPKIQLLVYSGAGVVADTSVTFVDGEYTLGEYHVAILRQTSTGWTPTIPPLNAVVTNYRLILQPQTRRPYPPASIPSNYITKVGDITLGNRKGVKVALKTGHRLYMVISYTQGNLLTDTIKTMMTSPIGNTFKPSLAERDIDRLIRFIQRL
jgi:hypothetical protein